MAQAVKTHAFECMRSRVQSSQNDPKQATITWAQELKVYRALSHGDKGLKQHASSMPDHLSISHQNPFRSSTRGKLEKGKGFETSLPLQNTILEIVRDPL